MPTVKRLLNGIIDVTAAPATYAAALWFRRLLSRGIGRFSARIFDRVGVFPVVDHCSEPLINPRRHLRLALDEPRVLPGIDLNDAEQLEFLESFSYQAELAAFPVEAGSDPKTFRYNNGTFGPGDAEFFYSVVRRHRPRLILEVGSGNSTLIARHAVLQNSAEDKQYACRHVCIEPYECHWLEEVQGVEIIRQTVETVDPALFAMLSDGDVLFIDSSHVIRPQGDVVAEVLEIMPRLQPGVLVHIHDIFTPRDYPKAWIVDQRRLYNEQYLLEAFLTFNREFRIVGALNYLHHRYPEAMRAALPVLGAGHGPEPRSLWLQRTKRP